MDDENRDISKSLMNSEYYIKEINFLKEQIDIIYKSKYQVKEENMSLLNKLDLKSEDIFLKMKRIENLQSEVIVCNQKVEELNKYNEILKSDNLRFLDSKKTLENNEQSLKNEINEIKKENEFLKQQLQNSTNSSNQYSNEILANTEKINKLKKEFLNSEFEKDNLKFKINQLESQIQNMRDEKLYIQTENQNEKTFFDKERSEFNSKIKRLNEDIITNKQNYLNKINSMESSINSSESESFEFRNKNNSLEQQNSFNTNKITELLQLTDKLQSEIINRENKISFLSDIINEKEREIKAKGGIIIELNQKLESFYKIETLAEKRFLNSVNNNKQITFSNEKYLKIEADYKKLEGEINICKIHHINKINQIDELNEKVKSLEDEKFNLNGLKSLLIENNKELELKCNLFEVENDDLIEYNHILSQQNRELMFELAMNYNKDNIERLIVDKEEYEILIKSKVDEFEISLNKLIKENKKLNKELTDKTEKMNLFENKFNDKEKDYLALEDEHKDIINKLNEAMEKYDNLNQFYKNKYTVMTYKFTDNNFDISSHKKLEKEYQELQIRFKTATEKIKKSEEKNSEYEKKITSLNENLFQLQHESLDKDKKMNNYENELENLNNFNRNLKSKISNLDLITEQKNKEIQTLKNENNNLSTEKSSYRVRLENLMVDANTKMTQLEQNFQQKLNELMNENSKLKEIFSKLVSTFDIESSKDFNIINQSSVIAQYSNNMKKLNEKLIKNEALIINLTQENFQLNLQNDNLSTINGNLKAKLELAENQNKMLTMNLYKGKHKSDHQLDLSQFLDKNRDANDMMNDNQIYEKYLNALKKIDDFIQQINNQKNKIFELENFNKDLLNNNFQASYNYMLRRIEELNSKNDDLMKKISHQNSENEGFNKIFAELKIENDNHISKRNSYECEILNMRNKIENYQKLIEEKDFEIAVLRENLDTSLLKENTINHLKNDIDVLVHEKECLSKELEELNNFIKSERENLLKEVENLNKINKEQSDELKKINEFNTKSFNEREKELKDEYEKKLNDTKSKVFSQFFLILKKAKNTIESLTKLEKSLQFKISNIEENLSNSIPIGEHKNKVSTIENQISLVRKKNKELESLLDEKTKKYNYELDLLKSKEEKMLHEIKLFKNFQENQKVEDGKPEDQLKIMFSKMIKSLYTATNVVSILERSEKQLKAEIDKLKNEINEKKTQCDICISLKEDFKLVNDLNLQLKSQLAKEKSELSKVNNQSIKNEIEKNLIFEDCKIFSQLISQKFSASTNLSQNDSLNKIENERNKNFSLLLAYMKKSTKVISALSEEIRILQGKLEFMK